jgi:hypothetical protein
MQHPKQSLKVIKMASVQLLKAGKCENVHRFVAGATAGMRISTADSQVQFL